MTCCMHGLDNVVSREIHLATSFATLHLRYEESSAAVISRRKPKVLADLLVVDLLVPYV
jgi:hypothetical protein